MKIPYRVAPERALSYGDVQTRREQAKAMLAERRREVETGAVKALSSARLSGTETVKAQARAKLQQIRERLNILKQLYAANPKEMARALAQVFKEMKAAVKAYKEAGGQALAMSGESVRSVMSEPRGGPGQAEGSDGASAERQAEVSPGGGPSRGGAALYDETVDAVRAAIGTDGLAFVKEVRGLTNKIQELLEAARGQARIRKADKDTDEAMEQADDALKDLRKAMADMENDIRVAAPAAGMSLSIAA